MVELVNKAYEAFIIEDEKLNFEADQYGHPFTICTNGAIWLKENFFPKAQVMGYSHWNNTSILSEWCQGHDFLVLDGYIIDFWPKVVLGENLPILINIKEQKEYVTKYYGNPDKWENLNR